VLPGLPLDFPHEAGIGWRGGRGRAPALPSLAFSFALRRQKSAASAGRTTGRISARLAAFGYWRQNAAAHQYLFTCSCASHAAGVSLHFLLTAYTCSAVMTGMRALGAGGAAAASLPVTVCLSMHRFFADWLNAYAVLLRGWCFGLIRTCEHI